MDQKQDKFVQNKSEIELPIFELVTPSHLSHMLHEDIILYYYY